MSYRDVWFTSATKGRICYVVDVNGYAQVHIDDIENFVLELGYIRDEPEEGEDG